ncbi:MAG TPA: right-handed parallel beta-helix repeat-containing protein [Planctomycetota bacterium]|nr:right-handed parallel beta-helix repeat-containing protein [Planctomycetota bacterium]
MQPIRSPLAVRLSACLFAGALAAQEHGVAIAGDDFAITSSCKLAPGVYRFGDAHDDGIVRVTGNDLTIDCRGVTIDGANDTELADAFHGFGIVADGCRNLTIEGLVVRGTKIGMYFVHCDGLTLRDCDVSGNFRQHLRSTPRAEDGADWLFGHDNDDNQWFRYGAGIYVERSSGVTVAHCRARRGQNGVCLSRVDASFVVDNDMSFLSGWGLAMWRSSRNDVSNNKFDWCMRGFSYGVYHRGQDSAGILVYEQCCDNVFAFNSATHGGDGFFLYAGNETLQRTGTGGCNGNLLYHNDFSHAAANGIEATFSQGNRFVDNVLDECDHGIWGGYSHDTLIVGNTMRDCSNGISIEHGHGNRIDANTFERCGVAIHLWGGDNPDFAKTPYGQRQDTRSHGYVIANNTIRATGLAIALEDTSDVQIAAGAIDATYVNGEAGPAAATALRTNGRCADLRADASLGRLQGPVRPAPLERAPAAVEPVPAPHTRGTQDAFLPPGALRGRRYIFVDDWGPYDFTSVRLFPDDVATWGSAEIFALGPDAEFTIGDVTGDVTVTPRTGRLPATITVRANGPAGASPFSFRLQAGEHAAAAKGLILRATWHVVFHGWDDQGAKQPPRDWQAVLRSPPLDTMQLDGIRFRWGGGRPSDKVPPEHFATVATTEMELPAGRYEVRTISDDGVRLWIDGKVVIDNWTWHPPHEDVAEVALERGKHAFRLEHFEIDGVAQLELDLRPLR